jgi:hypothetical protein
MANLDDETLDVPVCEHGPEADECCRTCADCGHRCKVHGLGEPRSCTLPGCDCASFSDDGTAR